jgi:hypothetical protein
VPKDLKVAAKWYEKSAEQVRLSLHRETHSCRPTAIAKHHSLGAENAAWLYGASQGLGHAQFNLGRCFGACPLRAPRWYAVYAAEW